MKSVIRNNSQINPPMMIMIDKRGLIPAGVDLIDKTEEQASDRKGEETLQQDDQQDRSRDNPQAAGHLTAWYRSPALSL